MCLSRFIVYGLSAIGAFRSRCHCWLLQVCVVACGCEWLLLLTVLLLFVVFPLLWRVLVIGCCFVGGVCWLFILVVVGYCSRVFCVMFVVGLLVCVVCCWLSSCVVVSCCVLLCSMFVFCRVLSVVCWRRVLMVVVGAMLLLFGVVRCCVCCVFSCWCVLSCMDCCV